MIFFRILLLIIVLIGSLIAPCHAEDVVSVVILPFQIHAEGDISYLKTEIPKTLGDYLQQEGAETVQLPQDQAAQFSQGVKSNEDVRRAGIIANADFAVWGSFTRIEEKYSLDAKVLNVHAQEPPNGFYSDGQGIENLLSTIKSLSKQIGSTLFKHQLIADVMIKGNNRIEEDAIQRVIASKPGQKYTAKGISDDLKAVYAMGYFDDIRIISEDSPAGKVITFEVTEKPTIRRINISDNTVFDDDEILESLTLSSGAILNIFKINSNIEQIQSLYKEKNYHNVKVEYKVHSLKRNQADLEFIISEGKKVLIKSITFDGNEAYDDKRLKKLIKTSEKGFFSFFTASGDLKRENLDQDISKIAAFYHNSGYIDARVGEPQIELTEEWIYITIKIEEGPRFKVGSVEIAGDLIFPKEELLNKLNIGKEEFYNREIVRNDIIALTDIYADEGYAYADIAPIIDENKDELIVNITYSVNKGKQVYFEKIIISGNTITRDKVIRRELQVYEQELFSGKKMKRGIRNLYRLDYFEDIKIDTVRGSADDKMILKVDISEKPTGSFTFGGGWSTFENFYVTAAVAQRNLFGRGQTLQLKADFGSRTTRYTLSFTEPYLFDIPLSMTAKLYKQDTDELTYDRDSVGGLLGFGYQIFDFTRAYLTYSYDISDIKNIDEEEASSDIIDLAGTNVTSSITGSVRYDSRDKAFNPTEGANHRMSVEYAGLGGDVTFTKYTGEAGLYIPLFKDFVGFIHGEAGYVQENPGGILPDYERFYLGGLNSVRGFKYKDIFVTDEQGDEIGGNSFIQGNVELIFPLVKKVGLMAVLFYDTGDVFGEGESIGFEGLRQGGGYGFRWYSPIGAIRVENGYILDPRKGEKTSGRWEIGMGQAF